MVKISIIIPTLNEEQHITMTLQDLQCLRQQGHEIIVVDGGSEDKTLQRIGGLYDSLISSQRGRARQMHEGAIQASGSILWFLHADTRVPKTVIDSMIQITATSERLWGRFDIKLSGTHPLLRIVERLINLRSRLSGIATGDQGIFISRALYEQVGGYPQISLMEDVALSKRLKQQCKPLCLHQRLLTSSRRWEEKGIMRTIFLMWSLRLAYAMGVSPGTLARYYR
ncbi:MAG: glycosyltransferase family 2 protein [Gammaproteobacteria bacterium]|nr:glycosyltransferase family 2 protein [Gammaproteobacteria bacterium]